MSNSPTAPPKLSTTTWLWNCGGFALIALSFIMLILAAYIGVLGAAAFGNNSAKNLMLLALLMVIALVVTINKDGLLKAKARVVVGILLCIFVGYNIATATREGTQAKQFLQQALDFQAKQTVKLLDLGRRFDEVVIEKYLSPEMFTSAQHIAEGKVVIERYRSLLQERNLLLQTFLAEYAAFIATIPAGETRKGAEAAIGESTEATVAFYKLLDSTQGEYANAVSAIFEWTSQNRSKISMRNGELQFSNPKQRQELQTLVNRLQQAENEANAANEKVQAARAIAEEKNRLMLQEINESIAK